MFDVGLAELAVIAFIGVLVLGPDKLPGLAKQAAVMVRKFREVANSARDEIRTELGPEYSSLELRDLDPRTMVRKHISEAMSALDEEDAAAASSERTLPEGQIPPYDPEST